MEMQSALPAPPRNPLLRCVCGPWLMALVLFAFTLALHTRHNDFSFSYHPDEDGKAGQIIAKSRNYHHPLLLLSTTDWVLRLGGIERTPQKIVETGRWVSAAFTGGSVVALALIAYFSYGLLAGWGAGLVVALNTDLFETAHYMKEDPALMFGLALALLAAHLWWRAPGRRTLRFLAIACAVAASGKYLGIVTLFFAVPLILVRKGDASGLDRRARWKAFAIVFGLTFLICNTPLFVRKISSPFRSISNEMSGVTGGHHGLTRKVPHSAYVGRVRDEIPRAIPILAGVYALALLATARRRTPPEWLTLLFPVAYFAMLSFSPKVADRYLMPVTTMVAFLGALGAAEAARFIGAPGSRLRNAAYALALAGLIAWVVAGEIPFLRRAFANYQRDDHVELAEWIVKNLPPAAVIAEDHRAGLSITEAEGVSKDARIPNTVLDSDFAADLGTLDGLRAQGVTHVAVSKASYGRFIGKDLKPGAAQKERFERRKAFYEQLFEQGVLVKEWPSGPITYLQPGIKLYSITDAPAPPAETRDAALK